LSISSPNPALQELAGLSSPDSACGKLQRICLELLREHGQQGEDGLPTNARFLAYELIQRGVLKKQNEKGRLDAVRPPHSLIINAAPFIVGGAALTTQQEINQ
jgi:hypothetical protein